MQNDPELRFWQSLTSLVRAQVESDAEASRAPELEAVAAMAPTPPITPPCSSTVAHRHSIDYILSQNQSMAFPVGNFRGAASSSHEVYLCAIPTIPLPPAAGFLPIPDYKTTAEWATQQSISNNYTDYSDGSLLDDACDSAKRGRWTLARLLFNAYKSPQ